MVKRCFSICRKKELTDCERSRFCQYANGKTRKYCRLSRKYKLDKECNIVKKPITKAVAKRRIKQFIKTYKTRTTKQKTTPKHSLPKNITVKKSPGNIIRKFMLNKRHKIRSEFLKTICSDSGFCLALGKEEKKITEFFDGFVNFKMTCAFNVLF